MVIEGTPVEHYPQWDLFVKREDMCCPGGPHFSKTRGVFAHAKSRPEQLIGVLDTAHSRGGHAVARACKLLDKRCKLYYPIRKSERGALLKPQQIAAMNEGAKLWDLPAGRSAVLYHQAKKLVEAEGGYMFPNALKLTETVVETKKEFQRTKIPDVPLIIVSASSGTIAAGVIAAAVENCYDGKLLIHLGYSRPERAFKRYLEKMSGVDLNGFIDIEVVDEGYMYADQAWPGETPLFPCDPYYDLKAFRFWLKHGRANYDSALLWNVG